MARAGGLVEAGNIHVARAVRSARRFPQNDLSTCRRRGPSAFWTPSDLLPRSDSPDGAAPASLTGDRGPQSGS